MNIYSYTPERVESTSKTIAFCILGGAAILVLLGEFVGEYKPILQTAGFVLAMGGVLVCSRFLLSGYTYNIEAADGASPDLVIIEHKGKTGRTVCRVSLAGGRLFRPEKGKRLDPRRIYDYRPSPFAPDSWVYEVPERDGEGFVRFSPNAEMVEIMRELGCEVSE